jgi:hypothetical protein
VALLDATFYSPDELPDRDVSKIRHPLVTDSMELLGPQVKAGKVRVLFTHLNHSNPPSIPTERREKPSRPVVSGSGRRRESRVAVSPAVDSIV